MALEFKRLPRPGDVPGALATAEQKLWLTAGRDELVADGDRRAAFLFCVPGDEISREEAERYGLLAPAPPEPSVVTGPVAIEVGPPPEASEEPVEKQAAKPANKRRKRGSDK